MATYIVTNIYDSGSGSLRDAIASANATVGADTISFDATVFATVVPQTITLTTGQLNITDDLTIIGTGANKLTVSGNQTSRVFNVTAKNTTIDSLTISKGKISNAREGGGGISISSSTTLNLNNSIVSLNSATQGGGIENNGILRITKSTITGNSVTRLGGGIQNFGTLSVSDSTISSNSALRGGGIQNFGTLTLVNTTLSGNSASNGSNIQNFGTVTGNLLSQFGVENFGTITINPTSLPSQLLAVPLPIILLLMLAVVKMLPLRSST